MNQFSVNSIIAILALILFLIVYDYNGKELIPTKAKIKTKTEYESKKSLFTPINCKQETVYMLTLKIEGIKDIKQVKVTEQVYNLVNPLDTIKIGIRIGRISKLKYVDSNRKYGI